MAFDDCDQLDITGPYEIFMQAADSLKERDPVKHALELKIVAVPGATDDPNVVRARQGLRFGCEPRDPAEALPDVLVIAGGLFGQDASGCDVGITKQLHNPAFTGLIMEQHGSGLIASVCTAALALVGTNLARGRTLTTHPGILDMVVAGGARVLNPDWEARVVDAGDIVSCGGVTSGCGKYGSTERLWSRYVRNGLDGNVFVGFGVGQVWAVGDIGGGVAPVSSTGHGGLPCGGGVCAAICMPCAIDADDAGGWSRLISVMSK